MKYALRFYAIQNFLDGKIFPLACRLLSFFKRKGQLPDAPKRILFIGFSGLGDGIQMLPIIKRLKERYPGSRITVVCLPRNMDAFEHQPFIHDRFILSRASLFFRLPLYILRNFRAYDLCVDAEANFRLAAIISFFLSKRTVGFSYKEGDWFYDASVKADETAHGLVQLASLLEPLGVKFKPRLVPLHTTPAHKKLIDARFRSLGINPKKDLLVGVHAFAEPTVAWRAYPKEQAVELVRRLRDDGCCIALTGMSSDSTAAKQVIGSLSDTTNVYDFSDLPSDALFYLIKNYSLLISMNSSPRHIAAAEGVPLIALFGHQPPTQPDPFMPKKHVILYRPPKGHNHKTPEEAWAHGCAPEYMKQITVDEIHAAARKLLGRKLRRRK